MKKIKNSIIKNTAKEIVKILQDNNHQAYWAGGCVRDQLLGITPKDYDIATSALPHDIENLFNNTIPIGKKYGTIIIVINGIHTEVTTFRNESQYNNGRHPEKIIFSNAEEDAKRRDFTINGMFYDPIKNELIDFVEGEIDLKNQVIRTIGNPEERFKEDHLRILRAVRFSHKLGFSIDHETLLSIKYFSKKIKNISIERITEEFSKILTESQKAGDALEELYQLKLLENIIPELIELIGVQQPQEHHPEGDVFTHIKNMLNFIPSNTTPLNYTVKELAFTILLHDIAKPETFSIENQKNGIQKIRFIGHEVIGAKKAKTILERLKFSNSEKYKITTVIRDHMKPFLSQHMKKSTLLKMMAEPTFDLLLELHRIDGLGSKGMLSSYLFLNNKLNEFKKMPILPKPLVKGDDILKLDVPNGPKIKEIIKAAYDQQLDNNISSKKEILRWIKHQFHL